MSKTNRRFNQIGIALALAILVLTGCAKERPVKAILANGHRVPAKVFNGIFLYQKSVGEVHYAGKIGKELIPGSYIHADLLVKFVRKENTLDVVSVDPLFNPDKPVLENTILASFKIKNVDVLRKQNADLEDTHEEEETDTRRPWAEREYIILDATEDSLDSLSNHTVVATTPDQIDVDAELGAINLSVTRQLKDDSLVGQKYSFLPYRNSETYVQKPYPQDLQAKFGYFKTSTYQFDKYGRITNKSKQDYMNRWDTSKPVVYYLSKNFPAKLKPLAQKVFAGWNEVFRKATGRNVLELRENSGQELGDLRYSMLSYDDTVDASHGVLGYGPSVSNPRTGEIVKADVVLFGGVLNRQIYRERIWERLLGPQPEPTPTPADPGAVPTPASPVSLGVLAAHKNLGFSSISFDKLFANGFAGLTKLKNLSGVRDEAMRQDLKTNYATNQVISEVQKEFRKPGMRFTTNLTSDVEGSIREAVAKEAMTDDEIEAQIFLPLLTHELGHNFNLRHNFMASADERHYGEHAHSSSVMDYAFLTSEEPAGPGPYDFAAIQLAYGSDDAVNQKSLADNFFFCTDENTMDSQNSMCNQFDSGNSLEKVIDSQSRRYFASYLFNNLRMDKAQFGGDTSEYLRGVMMKLIPIRLGYDYANAVVEAAEDVQEDQVTVWKLLRQRIEADLSSDPANVTTIKVLAGSSSEVRDGVLVQTPIFEERKLDLSKLPAIVADAEKAKETAFNTFAAIILDTDRPNYGGADVVHGDLLSRGVLLDKILAMQFLLARTNNPRTNGTITTVAQTLGYGGVEEVLRMLISNVVYNEENGVQVAQPASFDINLRETALDLLVNELSLPGGSAHTRKLIVIERTKVDPSDANLQVALKHRNAFKDLYKKLINGGLTPEERAKVLADLSLATKNRSEEETVVFHLPFAESQHFRAPLDITNLQMKTATGDLIRYGINEYTAIHQAVVELREEKTKALEAELAKPTAEQKPEVIMPLMLATQRFSQMAHRLSEVVEQEEAFLVEVAKLYDPRN